MRAVEEDGRRRPKRIPLTGAAEYSIPGLEGTWVMRGLSTTNMGADGKAEVTFYRVDPFQTAGASRTEAVELRAASVQRWNELENAHGCEANGEREFHRGRIEAIDEMWAAAQ